MNLRVVQFQYGFELIRLTYPQFVQTFRDIIGWNFWHRQYNFVPSCIEFLNIIIMKSDRERISTIQYCIMSANHPKIVVDHDGDLSFSVVTDPLSRLSAPRDWPSSWTGNSGWSCSEQKRSSRPTSRSLENPFHKPIARISIHPLNQPSPPFWSTT